MPGLLGGCVAATRALLAMQHGFFDAGLGRFLVSPGFAGLAALVGGSLAYAAARRKGSDDREAARQQRWWEAVTWVYDRATGERVEARLTGALALDMLERLFDEAHTDLELQTVLGLLGLFRDETEAAE